MSFTEGILLWTSMGLYFFSFILTLTGSVFTKKRLEIYAWIFFLVAFLSQTATILYRWGVSGQPPVMISYEHYQVGSWFVGVAMITGGFVYRAIRRLTLFSSAVIIIMLGIGVGTPSEIVPLSPPYRSNWLWIHIGFAWFAWGCFVLAAILGAVYLFKSYVKDSAFWDKFPALPVIDDLIIKFVLFGVVCQGLMIIAGAIWAHQLWGRYWGWDPIETWSLVCWLVYGLVLHLRFMMGWRGKVLAFLVILALLTAIMYFWGIGFTAMMHTPLMIKGRG